MDCDSVEGIMKSDEEMGRDKPSGASSANHNHYSKSKGSESRRMVDITRDKPIKVAVRVVVPVRDHPKEEELRASGDPKFQHLSEELHVEISAFATPAEAHARIAYALAEVRRFLVPDYNDDIRQEQMWEMQVLSSQRNNNKGDEASGGSSSGAEYAGEDRLSSETAEPGPESPQDEHPALRGIQPGTPSSTETTASATPANGSQLSPTNGIGNGPATGGAVVGVGGRKRPLLAGGLRTSMTPTKRTVMSLLARARAAQAKQLPSTFQRGTPEKHLVESCAARSINYSTNFRKRRDTHTYSRIHSAHFTFFPFSPTN
ncbi:KH domain-containing, RNA-binding, signal transduction-associated protein 2-like isoform X3 [Tenebrio molitor]|uniref:KH domain-containing, RNA-binding, signal transduction-associated protein 2-like isoform X3 n=1 Tax=Tenebrio molitor TaxID=7067 RepID=UPI0036249AEA